MFYALVIYGCNVNVFGCKMYYVVVRYTCNIKQNVFKDVHLVAELNPRVTKLIT